MTTAVMHECGGIAYLSGKSVQQGWNKYCCSRCGEVFYKWITAEMLKKDEYPHVMHSHSHSITTKPNSSLQK